MTTFFLTTLLSTTQFQDKKDASSVIDNTVNFRMGFSSATTNGHPTICLEGRTGKTLSFETCGTGYGFVHRDPGIDFLHVRGNLSVFSTSFTKSELSGQIGVGFAEIQISEDQMGFHFGDAGSGNETSGPEISGALNWAHKLSKGSEFVLNSNTGLAYFHFAPDLALPQPQVFPFVELSAGIGW